MSNEIVPLDIINNLTGLNIWFRNQTIVLGRHPQNVMSDINEIRLMYQFSPLILNSNNRMLLTSLIIPDDEDA